MHGIISNELIWAIKDQLRINWDGIHGVSHLARVYENGLHLADSTASWPRPALLFREGHGRKRLGVSEKRVKPENCLP